MVTKFEIFEKKKIKANPPEVGDFVIVELSMYSHKIAIPITRKNISQFKYFQSKTIKKRDGNPFGCNRSGEIKFWKTRPEDFKVPVKNGMYNHFYIDQNNYNEWLGVVDVDKNIIDFFNNNVAKIIKINPDKSFTISKNKMIISDVFKDEIKYWAKNEDEVEAIRQGAKFGI